MASSYEHIRKKMRTTVAPTPQDKGLRMTLTIDAYDNGMVNVDGTPMNDGQDQVEAWLRAGVVVVQRLEEFQRQATKRRTKRAA
jgi:hypothetical protein